MGLHSTNRRIVCAVERRTRGRYANNLTHALGLRSEARQAEEGAKQARDFLRTGIGQCDAGHTERPRHCRSAPEVGLIDGDECRLFSRLSTNGTASSRTTAPGRSSRTNRTGRGYHSATVESMPHPINCSSSKSMPVRVRVAPPGTAQAPSRWLRGWLPAGPARRSLPEWRRAAHHQQDSPGAPATSTRVCLNVGRPPHTP